MKRQNESTTSEPTIRFAKDGELLPADGLTAPAGANDLKIVWRGGRIVAACWTKNCRPIARIDIPADANDVRFETGPAPDARDLRPGATGDDVQRLQEDLVWLGSDSIAVTGVFDAPTEAAVRALQASRDLCVSGVADAATREAIETLAAETAAAELTPLTADDVLQFAMVTAAVLAQDKPPEGPKHRAWKAKLQEAFARRLREEGFTENEIWKIVLDALTGLRGILKNVWRLYKALRAYEKAKKDAGPEPKWDE